MKKTTQLILGAAAVLVLVTVFAIGCKNNSAPVSGTAVMTDTTGLAEFRNWKLQQQLAEMQAAADMRAAAAVTPKRSSAPARQTVHMTSSSTNEAKVAKKKGWSKAAKYAVIGGATGAVGGAVINKKNPVKGAVIGAVILGGGGYIFGRSKDKQEGRY